MALANAPQIGTSQAGLATLKSLGIHKPDMRYDPEVRRDDQTSGGQQSIGAPVITWNFGFLTQTERDTLRTIITGNTRWLYCETRTNDSDDTYAQFYARAIWPAGDENKDGFYRVPFVVVWRQAIPKTPL